MPAEFRRWLVLLRIPLALAGIILFFALYNRYLVDANLRNLKTSLSVLNAASGVGQAEAALLLVNQTLNSQMAAEELDLQQMTTLQYAQGTLTHGQRNRPVADSQTMLSVLKEEQSLSRSPTLNTLDSGVSGVQNTWRKTALLPRQVLGGSLSNVVDEGRLAEAARLEGTGHHLGAAQILEAILREYPKYRERVALRLRLGSLHQRMQEWSRARKLYQEALGESRSLDEADVARQMLQNLSQTQLEQKNAQSLEKRLAKTASPAQRQEIAFELGSAWIRSSDPLKAAGAFKEAVQADPDGRWAPQARFKEAWCLRSAGRLEESLGPFLEIARQNPKNSWAAAAYQQIAEIYRATGDLKTAAQIYEQAIAQSRDDAITAILYVQTGSTYQYDLNDPQKAEQFFREVQMKYPASSFSPIARKLMEIQTDRGNLPSFPRPSPERPSAPPPSLTAAALTEGSPLMTWMESFLPVFVDVFADRLAKYMEAAGEKALTRRFTDLEFRDLVARQVQRRFPGQVSEIETHIQPEGFVGTGTVRLGLLTFPLKLHIGVVVVDERPNAVLHEILVAKFPLPKALLSYLEKQVNASVQKTRYPLKIKQYELHEGYALISVELSES